MDKGESSPKPSADPADAHDAKQVTRRSFLAATAASAAVLCAVGAGGSISRGEPLLRPPGGEDEGRLLALCNRCGRCVSVCHTDAVGTAGIADGIVSLNTPVMRFDWGVCDFCEDCARVCPTGALRPFRKEEYESAERRIGVAVLDESTCLAWLSNSCNICQVECPYDAIELDEANHPRIIEEKCNGCGVCEKKCPVLSLRSYTGSKAKAVTIVREVG